MLKNREQQIDYLFRELLLHNAAHVVLVVVLAIFGWILLRVTISRVAEHLVRHSGQSGKSEHAAEHRRATTLAAVVRKFIGAIYWIGIVLTVLGQLGVHVGALLASAGVVGLSVSFGAQALVKNCIAGFFIILENQFSVGDVVSINGIAGTVEAVNFRTTLLRGKDGTLHVVQNGDITQLANHARDWNAYVFEVCVPGSADVHRVMNLLQEIGGKIRQDPELGKALLADLEIWGVSRLQESGLCIGGRLKTAPGFREVTERAFLEKLHQAFQAQGLAVSVSGLSATDSPPQSSGA